MKIQHQRLLESARGLGISIKDISPLFGYDAAILEFCDKSELVIRGTPTSLLNVRSEYYCDNKQLTKEAFSKLEIPVPDSILFQNPSDKTLLSFFKPEQTYVCKPTIGTNGIGVILNIRSLEAIGRYWKKNRHLGNGYFLLEEQIAGEDLRIQVIGGRIAAACTRKPAHITGNGKKTVRALIEDLRAAISMQNPANKLLIDQTAEESLAEKGLTLADIPGKGQEIFLNRVSNMAQGAMAIDRTGEIREKFQVWVNRLAKYLETTYFALDLIVADLSKPPDGGAFALEINARPEWLHHTFSQKKGYDIPSIILRSLFELG